MKGKNPVEPATVSDADESNNRLSVLSVENKRSLVSGCLCNKDTASIILSDLKFDGST